MKLTPLFLALATAAVPTTAARAQTAPAPADAAHALMQHDPSMQARVFRYELHEFRVFYPGTVPAAPRRP